MQNQVYTYTPLMDFLEPSIKNEILEAETATKAGFTDHLKLTAARNCFLSICRGINWDRLLLISYDQVSWRSGKSKTDLDPFNWIYKNLGTKQLNFSKLLHKNVSINKNHVARKYPVGINIFKDVHIL